MAKKKQEEEPREPAPETPTVEEAQTPTSWAGKQIVYTLPNSEQVYRGVVSSDGSQVTPMGKKPDHGPGWLALFNQKPLDIASVVVRGEAE